MDNLYNIVKCNTLSEGKLQLAELTYTHQMYSGETSPERKAEVYHVGDAVAVLPYDPETKRVLLIEQFRIGAAINNDGRQIEIIAGSIDEGEEPKDAAIREAKEEANIDISELLDMSMFYPCSGLSDQRMYLYTVEMPIGAVGGVYGKQEEGEDIKVMAISLDDAMDYIKHGRIVTSAAIIALQNLKIKLG